MTAERGFRYWSLQCVEFPGAISEVTRLDQAKDTIREAIAWVAQLPADDFEIEIQPVIDNELQALQALTNEARDAAGHATEVAAMLSRELARRLTESMPYRDAAIILGVSHQRVAQLAAADHADGTAHATSAPATVSPLTRNLTSAALVKQVRAIHKTLEAVNDLPRQIDALNDASTRSMSNSHPQPRRKTQRTD